MGNNVGNQMLSESKFYMGYSRWNDLIGRYETWDESVERVMAMHREKFKDKMTEELAGLINFAEQAYKDKLVLGAQRALQFGGEQLLKHEFRLYNCVSTHCNREKFFQETMYLLLCGAGVGFSVQKHHVAKLPEIKKRGAESKVFVVPDNIEGWADAFGVLLSSYFINGGTFPEYKGYQVHFDFGEIRPKGSLISGGFKAPGADGLREALVKCEKLLEAELKNLTKLGKGGIPLYPDGTIKIRPIVAYDFVMHMSDAVLSGGVRRSATICLFSKDDTEMLNAKTGNWFVSNPQRARSNNSVMILRDEITREEWKEIIKSVKQVGEPGFIFTDNLEFTVNPLTNTSGL
jgi:ribonucleoside-diphosphate reductase alpha chain